MSEVNNEIIQSVLQIIKSVSKSEIIQQTVSQQQVTSLFDKLLPGQQIQATVLNPDFEGKVLLRIAGEKLLVDTPLQLKPGQHLNVEVVSKQGMIQLKVVDLPSQSSVQAQFLKLNLPIQEPLTQLLKQLLSNLGKQPDTALQPQAQLLQSQNPASANSISTNSMPELVQALTARILEQIPTSSQFREPKTFEKLLSESGIFLESKLLRGQTPTNDTKAILLRIAEQLRTSLTQSQGNSAVGIFRQSNAAQQLQNNLPPTVTTRTAVPTTNTNPAVSSPAGNANRTDPSSIPATRATPDSLKSSHFRNEPTSSINIETRTNPVTTANTGDGVSQLKGVIEKAGLTATQAAQKAMMLSRSSPEGLTRSITPDLLNNAAFRQALDLLPKTEFNLLLKQLLFRKSISALHAQSPLNALLRSSSMGMLLKAVESSLARIHTQQLASVPQEDSTRQMWQLEIPIRDQKELSSLMMRIEQDDSERKDDASGSTWTVCLNFDIGDLGHIHSKVRLTRDVISTHFWAEQQNTLKRISSYLPRLVKALEKLGLEVNHTTVSLGKPPDPVEIATIEKNLLDENA